MSKLKNIHPGEILLDDFLLPLNISQIRLATDIGVHVSKIRAIARGKRAIDADIDLRLSRAFGTSKGFWLGLQTDYDLEERQHEIANQLKHIQRMISRTELALIA